MLAARTWAAEESSNARFRLSSERRGSDAENLAVTRAVGSYPNPVARDRHAGIKRVGKVQEFHAHRHQDQAAVNPHHAAGLAGMSALQAGMGFSLKCRATTAL